MTLWPRLAELPLVVEFYALERIAAPPGSGYERVTTHVRLLGAGTDGLGEDIYDEQEALLAAGPSLPLAGEWTLGGFCDHLDTLALWPAEPEWPLAHHFRRWAYESAALDLALRQAGRSLHEVLGLEPQPVGFVNSLGLGDPPDRHDPPPPGPLPGLRFKLDAVADWTPAMWTSSPPPARSRPSTSRAATASTSTTLDALARPLRPRDHRLPRRGARGPARPARGRRAARASPDRVSYDAPILTFDDLDASRPRARSTSSRRRIGGLRALLDLYARCAAAGCACTAAAWASSASAAARSSCSRRSSTRTRPTTSRPAGSTRPTRPGACRRAPAARNLHQPASDGRASAERW